MENRRDFFKALGIFAAGVVGAKVASYTPKQKEEELQVAESVSVYDKEGNEYNMVVVPKKKEQPKPAVTHNSISFNSEEKGRITSTGDMVLRLQAPDPETRLTLTQTRKPRKLNS